MHSVLLPLAALLSAGAAASDHPATGLSATIGLEKVVHQVEMVDPVFPSSPRVYNVVQFNNRRGFPVEYAVSFITPVCNDKQCQLVEATMVWNPPGYFKRSSTRRTSRSPRRSIVPLRPTITPSSIGF